MRPKFKIVDSRDRYPGPGAYKFFSEFGIYEKDDSLKTKNYNTNKSKINISNRESSTDIKNNQ